MNLLLRWLFSAVAIMITAYVLPGVALTGFIAALMVALVLGLLNVFIKPILLLLTLPLTIVTLGLFSFVINALLVLLASVLVPGFVVRSFWWALLFSLILSIVTSFLHVIGKETVAEENPAV